MNRTTYVPTEPAIAGARRELARLVDVSGQGLTFLKALHQADGFGSQPDAIENLFDTLDKPWHQAVEYAAWLHAEKPTGPDDRGWDTFAAVVARND